MGDGKEPIEYGDIVRLTSERCEEYDIDNRYEKCDASKVHKLFYRLPLPFLEHMNCILRCN